MDVPDLKPVAEAAMQLRMSRERLIRAIQAGQVAGVLRGGRYFAAVDAPASEPGIEP